MQEERNQSIQTFKLRSEQGRQAAEQTELRAVSVDKILVLNRFGKMARVTKGRRNAQPDWIKGITHSGTGTTLPVGSIKGDRKSEY